MTYEQWKERIEIVGKRIEDLRGKLILTAGDQRELDSLVEEMENLVRVM